MWKRNFLFFLKKCQFFFFSFSVFTNTSLFIFSSLPTTLHYHLTYFISGYGPGRITSLCLVNRDTDAMVMTGSDDGSCRIWSGCFDSDGPNPRLAAAWRAYPDLHPRLRSPGLVLDWQQVNGSLVAGGDGPTLMWWDVSRELCTQGVSTGTDVL